MARRLVLAVATMALVLAGRTAVAAVTKAINYQAVLTSGGSPVTGATNVTFRIYDAASGGATVWTEARSVNPDAQGRLSLRLGEVSAIDENVFNGQDRWLGVTVSGDAEMSPRLPLASSSYSFRVATLDGAKAGTVTGDLRIAAAAASDKDASTSEPRVILISTAGDSVIIGPAGTVLFKAVDNAGNTEMSATIDPTVGPTLTIRDPGGSWTDHTGAASSYFSSGASTKNSSTSFRRLKIGKDGLSVYDAVGNVIAGTDAATGNVRGTRAAFGTGNTLSVANKDATGAMTSGPGLVAGDNNTLTGNNASAIGDNNTVGGTNAIALGFRNTVNGHNSVVGGFDNFLAGNQATVMGDSNYVAFGQAELVCFGEMDSIMYSAWGSVLGGHWNTLDTCPAAVIAGGWANKLKNGFAGAIGGGQDNLIRGCGYGTIGGGIGNKIDKGGAAFVKATIGGGDGNLASNDWATVGGGVQNTASGGQSTVGGGSINRATGNQSTVAGGIANVAGPSDKSTVGGGEQDTASGLNATVSGGYHNVASGDKAMIPGGHGNTASGVYSFAAGTQAKAIHSGAFVWADNNFSDFPSTASNQFLIRAGGNVGINTNSPSQPLTVAGTVYSTSGGFKFPDGSVQSSAASSITDGWTDDGSTVRLTAGADKVGIGTLTPSAKLDVAGDIRTTGNLVIPSDSGRIVNYNNRAILETWWSPTFGDYTAVNSGYNWDLAHEPISIVAGNQGVFFMKGSSGTPYTTQLAKIDSVGRMAIGAVAPTSQLDVVGATGYSQLRMRTSYTPANSADPNGNVGDIAWDGSFVYVKTAAGWKRSALSTF